MDLATYWTLLPRSEELKDLNSEQAQAMFRLMIVASIGDNDFTPAERVGLQQTVISLPFFEPHEAEMFETLQGIQVLSQIRDRIVDDFPGLLSEISAGLQDHGTRVLGLQLAARMVQTDGYSNDEHAVCMTIAQALGLEEDEATRTIEAAWALAEG